MVIIKVIIRGGFLKNMESLYSIKVDSFLLELHGQLSLMLVNKLFVGLYNVFNLFFAVIYLL